MCWSRIEKPMDKKKEPLFYFTGIVSQDRFNSVTKSLFLTVIAVEWHSAAMQMIQF